MNKTMGNTAPTDKKIEQALKYGFDLIGTPYGFYKGTMSGPPCHAETGIPESINECNCVGLINLIRKHLKLPIPGHAMFPGGVEAWIRYLEAKSFKKTKHGLRKFDTGIQYPVGTLLIAPNTYHDPGHVAIICSSETNPMESKILHSFPESEQYTPNPVGPGITVTTIRESHEWDVNGYYELTCPPDIWLDK